MDSQKLQQSLDVRGFVSDFVTHWRNLFLLSAMKGGRRGAEGKIARILEVTKRDFAQLLRQVESAENFDMHRLFELAEAAGQTALASNFPRFVLEAAVAKMALLPSLRPLGEIISAIESNPAPSPFAKASEDRSPFAKASGDRSPFAKASEDRSPFAKASEDRSPFAKASEDRSPFAKALEDKSKPSGVLTTVGFDPSWQNFITYVRGTRSEQRLAAHLSRVSPQNFGDGKLIVEGSEFDIDALKDAQTAAALKSCLQGYSGSEEWEVRFNVQQENKTERRRDDRPLAASIEKKRASNAAPGSLVALEEEASRQRRREIDGEARNDPMVKAALSMFEGSTIERVSVLKEEKER